MSTPNILLTRIDNRLVHGQVGVTWTSTIGANLLVVVDDDVAQDEIQQKLMGITAETYGFGIRFFSIEKNFVSFEKQDNCRFGGKSLDKFQKFEYDNNVNWKKHSSSAEFPVL